MTIGLGHYLPKLIWVNFVKVPSSDGMGPVRRLSAIHYECVSKKKKTRKASVWDHSDPEYQQARNCPRLRNTCGSTVDDVLSYLNWETSNLIILLQVRLVWSLPNSSHLQKDGRVTHQRKTAEGIMHEIAKLCKLQDKYAKRLTLPGFVLRDPNFARHT